MRPQKTCASVDDACRKIIEEHSYGPHFIHSTGHGIGLDVHENPSISGKSKEKLKKRYGDYGRTWHLHTKKVRCSYRGLANSKGWCICDAQIYERPDCNLVINIS